MPEVLTAVALANLLLAQAGDKLSPPASAAVLMALLGIALLGLLLIVIILLGGHWVRKQGNFRRGPSVPPDRVPLRPQTNDADETASEASSTTGEQAREAK